MTTETEKMVFTGFFLFYCRLWDIVPYLLRKININSNVDLFTFSFALWIVSVDESNLNPGFVVRDFAIDNKRKLPCIIAIINKITYM